METELQAKIKIINATINRSFEMNPVLAEHTTTQASGRMTQLCFSPQAKIKKIAVDTLSTSEKSIWAEPLVAEEELQF